MSSSDIYGSRLKCGNLRCSTREARMTNYLQNNWDNLDLNKLLVIDGFNFASTDIDLGKLLDLVSKDLYDQFRDYLMSYMNTENRKRNMDLVVLSAWTCLKNEYERRKGLGC
jgi:hypothetical protein